MYTALRLLRDVWRFQQAACDSNHWNAALCIPERSSRRGSTLGTSNGQIDTISNHRNVKSLCDCGIRQLFYTLEE